jgi:hypothetical protein
MTLAAPNDNPKDHECEDSRNYPNFCYAHFLLLVL